uniref:SprT-like domain-containing protein n=1 Tax=Globodera rostochiensis TaxID=31243 RepID=A0A914HXN7_GLORO
MQLVARLNAAAAARAARRRREEAEAADLPVVEEGPEAVVEKENEGGEAVVEKEKEVADADLAGPSVVDNGAVEGKLPMIQWQFTEPGDKKTWGCAYKNQIWVKGARIRLPVSRLVNTIAHEAIHVAEWHAAQTRLKRESGGLINPDSHEYEESSSSSSSSCGDVHDKDYRL